MFWPWGQGALGHEVYGSSCMHSRIHTVSVGACVRACVFIEELLVYPMLTKI